jgi:hypothetical protein
MNNPDKKKKRVRNGLSAGERSHGKEKKET